ncbi:hypothetical protein [Archangium sp.]|uniref:hypothetical protein n=1 Tax=Archangium sp. TaxID=1872627 RepID=UPI00389A65AC
MATLPPSRALARPALLLSFLSLACNNPPPPTTPDLPQVTLSVTEPNAVGSSFKLSIAVSGCEQVRSLEVLDNNALVKQVPYGGNPTAVELAIGDLRFPRNITLDLSLTARVTCADGRSNISQTQPATFFPVEEVVEPTPPNSQVVPDYFVVDGSGANASFIGCGREGNLSYLYKVPRSNPANYQKLQMPIPCDVSTTITDRKPADTTGTRWVWTPLKGAFAINTSFKITATSGRLIDSLTVAPDGNAFLIKGRSIQRLAPNGTSVWDLTELGFAGEMLGEPFVKPGATAADTTVLVPVWTQPQESDVLVKVGVLKYADGTPVGEPDEIELTNDIPLVAFDDTGTVLYLSIQGPTAANVKACAIGKASRCQPETDTLLWITEDLQGNMSALVPYANGTRLAALTTNRFWFLDVKSGLTSGRAPINKDHLPLIPTGSLVTRFVQPGLGNSSIFYMFNSAARTDSNPLPYPVELVATDGAEKGELYRYQVPGGSVYGALDDAGVLWLRIGPRLVKPFAPSWYRERR